MRTATLLATALATLLPAACAPVPAEPTRGTPAPAAPPAAPAPPVGAIDEAGEVSEPAAPTPVVAAPPAAPVPGGPVDDCGLKATIAADRGRDGATKYTLTLKNEGSTPRTLVEPGDGSEYGRRTPILAWSATRDGKPATELERPGCGMMNAIEASEIFTLAPGASRSMSTWIHGPSYAPGRYEVTLRYTNDPRPIESANVGPEVAALLLKTSACDVTSAPLALEVP